MIKWIYRISTGLFTAMLAMGAVMYFVQHQMASEMFTSLGFPTYIIYPLAIAKVLGLIALWVRKSRTLTDLAYAGFFFELSLAVSAHLAAGDGEFAGAFGALILLVTSYVTLRVYKRAEFQTG